MDETRVLWRLVLPVKGSPGAKSRLHVAPGVARTPLARAMALDAVDAALAAAAVTSVLVVTSDPYVGPAARAAGADVVGDPGTGLDGAVLLGRDTLTAAGPEPVAVLLADVPAVRPEDLTAALDACAAFDTAYLPDAEGSGTVLLAARRPEDLRPAFGDGSAARHDLVAKRLDLDLPHLRRDVDVAAALDEAVALGVGPHTRAALRGPSRTG